MNSHFSLSVELLPIKNTHTKSMIYCSNTHILNFHASHLHALRKRLYFIFATPIAGNPVQKIKRNRGTVIAICFAYCQCVCQKNVSLIYAIVRTYEKVPNHRNSISPKQLKFIFYLPFLFLPLFIIHSIIMG